MIGREALAIVWAQWRSLANRHSRSGRRRFPITAIFAVLWYGLWALIAVALGATVSDAENLPMLRRAAPGALLLQCVYWQMVPIIMVSTGVSLDLSRLVVYPIPHAQLFTIEVLLRVTTSVEMLLISCGVAVGILLNSELHSAGALVIPVFAVFNLFVCAGLKDLLGRLLVRKGFREATVFLLVLLAALPQVLLVAGAPEADSGWHEPLSGWGSPWGATARVAFGSGNWMDTSVLVLWTVAAWLFGRNQFERTLHFDSAEAKSRGGVDVRRTRVLDMIIRLASRLFKDPMAALVEKEIRFLSRSARFRLLFMMGFSFGLLIWLPMAARRDPDSFLHSNYLSVVSAYALMLLGEICFWNNLGLDRGATQAYFTMPVPIATVLRAKNAAAMFFIVLELLIVSVFCALLRMPLTPKLFAEAFCVTVVFAVFLLSCGNLLSVRHPRPVDPAQSWRHSHAGRAQAYLLFLYPAAAGPVALAFGARYAFDSELAFYAVLLLDLAIGVAVYSIALESSARTAHTNRESIVQALAKSEGPAAG